MLRDYARLIVFSIGLLGGVQLPGFVDQYTKRVEAHYLEAARAFSGFRATADRFYSGSLQALLTHHAKSGDRVFIEEAKTIESLQSRLDSLASEVAAMRAPLVRRVIHIVFDADREIFNETAKVFSYTVPLSPAAIICGVSIGLIIALVIESVLLGIVSLSAAAMHRSRRRHRPAPQK